VAVGLGGLAVGLGGLAVGLGSVRLGFGSGLLASLMAASLILGAAISDQCCRLARQRSHQHHGIELPGMGNCRPVC
jgi:hypothetical protein